MGGIDKMTELAITGLQSAIGGFTSSALDLVMYIILLIVLLALGFYINSILQYKYKVEVIMNTGGKDVAIDDKAKEIKDSSGTYWKLFKLKETIPAPPSEAIYLNNKGNIKSRCIYSKEGSFEWIDATIPAKKKDSDLHNNFDVLTTKHRSILVNQIIKAEERKKKNWKEYIPMIAGLGAIVILVVCMLIYWEQIVRPVVEVQNNLNTMILNINDITQSQAEITHRLEKIMNKVNIEIPIDKTSGVPD